MSTVDTHLLALGVPQLKALCKERGLTGYSKLNKGALIDKIRGQSSVAPVTTQPGPPSAPAAPASALVSTPLSAIEPAIPTCATAEASKKRRKENEAHDGAGLPKKMRLSSMKEAGGHGTSPGSASSLNNRDPLSSTRVPSLVLANAANAPSAQSSNRQASPVAPVMPSTSAPQPSKASSAVPRIEPTPTSKVAAPPVASTSIKSSLSKQGTAPRPVPVSVVPSTSVPRPTKTPSATPSAGVTPALDVPAPPAAPTPAKTKQWTAPRPAPAQKKILQFTSTNATRDFAKSVPAAPAVVSTPLLPPSKPFIKVVPKIRPSSSAAAPKQAISKTTTESPAQPELEYLSVVQPSPPPEPKTLKMPPRISQRAQVGRLAVILSYLDPESQMACVLVSKSWRYATYLSAQTILKRFYPGRRLQSYLHPLHSSLSQLNLWPYLRSRRAEASQRRDAYQKTFLYPLFGFTPLAGSIWTSSDDVKEAEVAIRFLMARSWLGVNVGDRRIVKWMRSVIVECKPVRPSLDTAGSDESLEDEAVPSAPAEIWKITVVVPPSDQGTSSPHPHEHQQQQPQQQIFHILAETGEVLGQPPEDAFATSDSQNDSVSSSELRFDWVGLLENEEDLTKTRMLERIKCANGEDYEFGISRHWLRRRGGEGMVDEVHEAERRVAERYVLASVAANSLSGRYQNAIDMARDFNGFGSTAQGSTTGKHAPVSLYLPEHHYVESVHFTTAHGRGKVPLHPALAVVQTPTREVFILRDTGSEVGTEEEGVKPVWMDLLGCTSNGIRTGTA